MLLNTFSVSRAIRLTNLSVLETRTITVSWEHVKNDFAWLTVYPGEPFARSYLLRHPELIERGLEFLGVELGALDRTKKIRDGSPKIAFFDALYRKGNRYYLVETKESVKQEASGRAEAENNARCLDEYFGRKKMDVEIVPVFFAVDFPAGKPKVGAET